MIGFYIALPCLLAGMIILVVMRRRHKEARRLRVECEVDLASPASLEDWRVRSQASLRASRARRGLENLEKIEAERSDKTNG